LLERDGVRLAYREYGGAGAPVVLLHGLAGDSDEWAETAERLRERHRVVALDARGHGRSERLPADVSRAAHVADVAFVIEQLGLAPVALIGQSLGGNTAMLVAAERPDLVASLVLAEAGPAEDPAAPAAVEEALRRRQDPPFDVELMVRTLAEPVGRSYWEEWERIECPTLIVRGGDGTMSAAEAEAMVERRPETRLVEIPGAGHDLHLDRPAEWARTVADFLG
jgi:pimeloyl-ACP methyl ester carboxylesterase